MARPLRSSASFEGRTSRWREHAPPPALSACVEAFWTGVGGWAHPLRLLPDGSVDIVWDGERLTAVALVDAAMRVEVGAPALNVGVRLRCGAAGSLLGMAPRAGQSDLGLAWGTQGRRYVARLRRTREPEAALAVLEALIEERLLAARDLDRLVLAAAERLRQGGAGSVDTLARSLGEDPRALRRRLHLQVGMGPKRLQRVFRLQAMLSELAAPTSAAGLAASLGFADQAHMVRECRAMTGSTPAALARALAA